MIKKILIILMATTVVLGAPIVENITSTKGEPTVFEFGIIDDSDNTRILSIDGNDFTLVGDDLVASSGETLEVLDSVQFGTDEDFLTKTTYKITDSVDWRTNNSVNILVTDNKDASLAITYHVTRPAKNRAPVFSSLVP